MKTFFEYLAPRLLVLAATFVVLKLTVFPKLSVPVPPAAWFAPVWQATDSVKQAVIQTSSSVFGFDDSRRRNGDPTSSEQPMIEICPAGSEPVNRTKAGRPVVIRPAGSLAPGASATTNPSRVASSKRP